MATEGPQTMVEANINYFPPDGPRIFYPGTAGYQRRNFDTRTMPIADVRESKEDLTLDKCGFQLAKNNWSQIDANDNFDKVRELVYVKPSQSPCAVMHLSSRKWVQGQS